MKYFVLGAIRKYQTSGGGRRWFGIECNFEPTCSLYTYDAIETYGLLKGIQMGFKRIRDCSQKDAICKCVDPIKKEESC